MDYVTKPFRIEELRTRLERAARAVELQQENQLLREQLRTRPGFGGLIGVSERMQRVYQVTHCCYLRFAVRTTDSCHTMVSIGWKQSPLWRFA